MPTEKQSGEEFFYLDENGEKQDANLHGPILAGGDRRRGLGNAPDEKIMKPIRDKHRAAWLAKRKRN